MNSITSLDIHKLTHKWISFGIEKCRPCAGTYSLYDGTTLPPLQQTFPNQFAWLKSTGSAQTDPFDMDTSLSKQVLAQCPSDFKLFLTTEDWLNKVDSPTACYFVLQETRFAQGALIEFYCDQQSCCHWFLWIDLSTNADNSSPPVLTSWEDGATLSQLSESQVLEILHVAETSFEKFLYRLYLENEIWMDSFRKNSANLFPQPIKDQYCADLKKITFPIKNLFDF